MAMALRTCSSRRSARAPAAPVYVVFGKAGGFTPNVQLAQLNGSNGFKLNGVAAQDFTGSSLAAAGDVNADGFADLVIGATGADPHGSQSGAAYLIFGKGGGFTASLNLSALNGTNGFKLRGWRRADFGVSVRGLAT